MYPAPARPGLGWKLLQSWWVLISIFGFGCFSGAGLVLVGLRARKPVWWGCGVAYLLVSTGMIVASEKATDPTDPASGGGFAALWLLLWIVCIVHSFVLNVYWLRWQEQRRSPRPPLHVPQAAFGSPAGYGSPVAFGSPVGPASGVPYGGPQYSTASSGFPAQPQGTPPHGFTSQPFTVQPFTATSATPATPWPAPTPWNPNGQPAAGPGYGPVDVNTADAALLGTLDDFDAGRVAYVLSERHRRGGFTSLAELAATAQLTPPQFERIQHRLTLSPPRRY